MLISRLCLPYNFVTTASIPVANRMPRAVGGRLSRASGTKNMV